MITLTDRERNVLAHVVIDPDAWLAGAIAGLGEDKAREALDAKVARWAPDYFQALQDEGANYKNRAARDAAEGL